MIEDHICEVVVGDRDRKRERERRGRRETNVDDGDKL
jgi:hypothetical protein